MISYFSIIFRATTCIKGPTIRNSFSFVSGFDLNFQKFSIVINNKIIRKIISYRFTNWNVML
jgi:hypothetical protein